MKYFFFLLLTLYYTIQTFNDSKETPFEKNRTKRRKSWKFPLPTTFSYLSNKNSVIPAYLKCCLQMISIRESLKFCHLVMGQGLTHYHTMLHFDAQKIYSYGKHFEKRGNCLLKAISPFLPMFSTLYSTYFSF